MPAAKLLKIAQYDDPKQGIIQEVGDLSKVSLFSGRVLLGIYVASDTHKKGIDDTGKEFKLLRISSNIAEDIWQAKVGLVLKKGAMAFKDDDSHKFHGQNVQVGDWVTFRKGDTRPTQINGVDCLIIEDALIDMVIDDPSIITHDK